MHRFQDAEVDSDHDLIISQFDALCGEVCWSPENRPAAVELLRKLEYYSSGHFQREEALMAAQGYEDLAEHRQAHETMRQEFDRLLGPLMRETLTLKADLRLLRDMFLCHIVTWDEAYGEWLALRRPWTGARPAAERPALLPVPARITVDHRLGITVLCPEGRITLGDGDEELGEAVRTQLAAGARKILLDFSHVSYLDSSGVGELVGCYTSVRNQGGDLKICGVNTRVFNIMKLTSLHAVFDVRDTEDEALAAF